MSLRMLTRALPRTTTFTSARSFSAVTRMMAEGDTGATRSGGGQGDAWQKREQASENDYVRRQELDKLAQLKRKIADQEAALAKDREEAEKLSGQK
ncbi:ATPase inhibitor [Elasticomyces elasticus]|nr:ATPase inhibitor [Elasticomyces elasticus]